MDAPCLLKCLFICIVFNGVCLSHEEAHLENSSREEGEFQSAADTVFSVLTEMDRNRHVSLIEIPHSQVPIDINQFYKPLNVCPRETIYDIFYVNIHPRNVTPAYKDAIYKANKAKQLTRIICLPIRRSENETLEVKLVNSTRLLQIVGNKNDSVVSHCTVVMFFAPWCMFCAKTAPHYNALARAFPQLEVLAIDAVHFSSDVGITNSWAFLSDMCKHGQSDNSRVFLMAVRAFIECDWKHMCLNTRYGTIAVPNILVFYNNSKAVAKFNHTERTFENFVAFVSNVTGFRPNTSVDVMEQDFEGPLRSVPSDERDWLLWLAWIFIIVFSITMVGKSDSGRNLWNAVLNFGFEHEQHLG